MAVVENPKSELPARLLGLHLFHFGGAPCAQRVRFVLAEKGFRRGPDVAWASDAPDTLAAPDEHSYVSRVVSLIKQDNLTEAYAEIQPNMVVPALVHDGVLHIESVDIMSYVDGLAGPSLLPDCAAGELCERLVERAKELHRAIRFMTYRYSLGGLAKINASQQAELDRLELEGSPEQLATFYAQFSSDSIPDAVYQHHLQALEGGFDEIEALLAGDGRDWLTGELFSMADILWAIKVQRVSECGYPFPKNFPHVHAWIRRVRARPGFQEAVWRDIKVFARVFGARAAVANALGRGIRRLARPPGGAAVPSVDGARPAA